MAKSFWSVDEKFTWIGLGKDSKVDFIRSGRFLTVDNRARACELTASDPRTRWGQCCKTSFATQQQHEMTPEINALYIYAGYVAPNKSVWPMSQSIKGHQLMVGTRSLVSKVFAVSSIHFDFCYTTTTTLDGTLNYGIILMQALRFASSVWPMNQSIKRSSVNGTYSKPSLQSICCK